MTGRDAVRLQKILSRSPAEICNRTFASAVIVSSVDATSTVTWLITTLLSWFRLPYGMIMKRLARSFTSSIRLLQKWSVRIDRDELVKRIFAK